MILDVFSRRIWTTHTSPKDETMPSPVFPILARANGISASGISMLSIPLTRRSSVSAASWNAEERAVSWNHCLDLFSREKALYAMKRDKIKKEFWSWMSMCPSL